MRGLTLTLVLALCGPAVRAEDDEPLPLVVERYDAVSIVHERAESRSWEASRVYFWRGGRVIADRIVCDDMVLSIDRGEFVLVWNDYGNCHRVVRAGQVRERFLDLDDLDAHSADSAPWWGMGRRATDLQQPEVRR